MTRSSWHGRSIYAVGHSTRPLSELIAMLESVGVRTLADVRTMPRSRTNPQFNRETLPAKLKGHGIRYVHLAELGGLRRPRKGSVNAGWRNKSFRGYADHMRTREFERGLARLKRATARGAVAFMCAEALRWRCHRSLIADALLVRGADVRHLVRAGKSEPHRLTPFARVKGRWLSYPP